MIHSIFLNWPQALENKKNYSYTLLDIKYANQKYKLIECPTESVNCKTAEHLGVETKSQIQLFTKTGEIFADLVLPKGFPFVYHRLLPNHKFIDNYYKSGFDSTLLESGWNLNKNSENIFQKRLVNKVEVYCSDLLKPKSKILDVGCGYGDQLYFFKKSGHEVVGIEPGNQRAEQAQLSLQSKVYAGSVESAEIYSSLSSNHGKFDLIYLNQVLEHLYSPVLVLKELLSILAPDGLIFILVPDFYTESVLNKILSVVHTHSFTAEGLSMLMNKLEMTEVRRVRSKHYNFMIFKKNTESVKVCAPEDIDLLTSKIEKHIKDQFGLINTNLSASDIVIQSSQLLGDSYAAYCYEGPRKIKKKSFDKKESLMPIHIHTKFNCPSFFFK